MGIAASNGSYCMICKDMASGRFQIKASDSMANVDTTGEICDHCYGNFVSSASNEGRHFKAASLRSWIRHWKKDPFRGI